MTHEIIEKKCKTLMTPILGGDRSQRLIDKIWTLEQVSNMRELRPLLSSPWTSKFDDYFDSQEASPVRIHTLESELFKIQNRSSTPYRGSETISAYISLSTNSTNLLPWKTQEGSRGYYSNLSIISKQQARGESRFSEGFAAERPRQHRWWPRALTILSPLNWNHPFCV